MCKRLLVICLICLSLVGCKAKKEIIYKDRIVTVTIKQDTVINDNGIVDLCKEYAVDYFSLDSSKDLESFITKYENKLSKEVKEELLVELQNMVFMSNLTFDSYYMDSLSDGERVWVHVKVVTNLDNVESSITDIVVSFNTDKDGNIVYVNTLVVPTV